MTLEELATNMATRMREIDDQMTRRNTCYDILWDAILDEFAAAGIQLALLLHPAKQFLVKNELPGTVLIFNPVPDGVRIPSLPYHVTNYGNQPVTMYAPNGTFIVRPGESVFADEEGNTQN